MITPWPSEDVAVLRRMWKDGSTGTQISKALGERYSRNAVQGKADRLGLANRPRKGAVPLRVRVETAPKPRGPKPRTRENANPRGNPSTAELKSLPPQPAGPSLNKRFPDLARGQCQFATSPHDAKPADHRFCGAPIEPSRPFCPFHCSRSYVAPKS
jgi:hypothetical protein